MSEVVPPPAAIEPAVTIVPELLANTVPSFKLNPSQMNILKVILTNSPSTLTNLNTCLLEIIKDGKIDATDVPSFMIMIQELYRICHENKTIKISSVATSMGPILKYIVVVFLTKSNLDTPNLITCCNNIIDTSIQMIVLQSTIQPKGCSFKLC